MDTHATQFGATDVEILRTGEFTAMDGRHVAIDEAMLSAIEETYSPDGLHEAKLTRDHQTSGEAVARITGLRKNGNRLLADFAGLTPDVAKSIQRDGVWNNRSSEISFTINDDKRPYLKNVSLLSARPPAIKGLKRIEPNQIVPIAAFSEPEGTATYSYYFEEVDMPDNPTPTAAEIALSEEVKQKDIALAEALAQVDSLKAKADKVDKLETIVLSSQAEWQRASAREFISQYPRRITPALRDIALACLSPDQSGEIALSESDGKTVKLSSAEAFKRFVEALPDFGPEVGVSLAAGQNPKPDTDLASEPSAADLDFAENILHLRRGTPEWTAHIEAIKAAKGGKQ